MLARISSASLVQANGRGWSFQLSMNAPMAAVSSLTEVKEPRRMAWRVMTGRSISTRLSQEHPVGVKCRVTLGFFASQAADLGVLVGGVVVADHVQLDAGVGGGDLLEELQELLVAVPGVAGVGDLAGGDVQGGEQAGDAVPDVVVGLPLGDARAHRQDRLGRGPGPGYPGK